MITEQEALEFYEKYINNFSEYNHEKWGRCEFESYRNELTKHLKYPQGHRWKYPDWFDIQDIAFKILVDKGKISENEYKFYCQKFKIL